MATLITWDDDYVSFDATASLEPEDTAVPTDHPVELGVNVTDHVRKDPEMLTIEGWVTNAPNKSDGNDVLSTLPTDIKVHAMIEGGYENRSIEVATPPLEVSPVGLIQAGVSALSSLGGHTAQVRGPSRRAVRSMTVQALQQATPRDRVRDVYEKLLKAQAETKLVSVSTPLREYYDMVITRIAAPRTVEDGSAVKFSVDIRRIRISESKTVKAPQPTEARGALGKNKGSQHASPASAGAEPVYESTLSMLTPG